MRVVVAMSGGVDSSVAAALLVEEGHEVIGLTMKLRDATDGERAGRGGSCCSPDDLMDARHVCDALGIPHYIIDYRELFRTMVMEPFAQSYLKGETPNPCVQCNDHVKFVPLLEHARALGAECLVTGHYARIEKQDDGWALLAGADDRKDQSYFLFGLEKESLPFVRFPLGDLSKDEVRDIAKKHALPNWDKSDSEDICFVPGGDYSKVVEGIVGSENTPADGSIVDASGHVLGTHQGIHKFTVGQRRGLGIASGERLYVVGVNSDSNTVEVGRRASLDAVGLHARDCRWLVDEPAGVRRCTIRIRYRHGGVDGNVIVDGSRALVTFDEPQFAVAPGQAVVFYDDDRVLGGGWIERAVSLPSTAEHAREDARE